MKSTVPTDSMPTAEEWVARLGAPDVSPHERAAFLQWCAQSAENVRAYERVAALHAMARESSDNHLLKSLSRQALARSLSKRPSFPRRYPRLLAAACAALVVGVAVPLLMLRWVAGTEVQVAHYDTGPTIRHVVLADGTAVTLDADTAMDVRFDDDRRSILFKGGRAQFDVARNDAPFEVRVGDAVVRDIGTVFQVSERDAVAGVTLIDGRVTVSRESGAPVAELRRGERVDMGADGAVRRYGADMSAIEAWTTGRLVFRDAMTKDLIETMNRYSDRKIRLENPTRADARLTGSFHAGDQDAVVDALSTTWALRVRREGNDIVLY